MKLLPLIENIVDTKTKNDLIVKYNNLLNDYKELRNEILFHNNSDEIVSLINSLNSKFYLKAFIHNNNLIVTHKENSTLITYYLPSSSKSFINLLNSFLLGFNSSRDYLTLKRIITLLNIG